MFQYAHVFSDGELEPLKKNKQVNQKYGKIGRQMQEDFGSPRAFYRYGISGEDHIHPTFQGGEGTQEESQLEEKEKGI